MLPTHSMRCRLAGAFAFCSLATFTLLANHPMAGAHTIADLIKAEARNQFADGLVHGGFIVTSSVLIVSFVFLSHALGMARVAVVAGLVAFCVGCGALMGSMILDGFVIPAIAVRFSGMGNADGLAQAQTLFILCGTLIRFLMPMGLLFQSAAMLSWSSVIVGRRGWRLAVGVFGLAGAIVLIGAMLAPLPRMREHVLLGGIVVLSVWYLALAGVLCARSGWQAPSANGRPVASGV
jgi:hypothetical protein